MSDRLLIVGGDGLLGAALFARMKADGTGIFFTSRRQLDRRDNNAIHFDLGEPEEGWPDLSGFRSAIICAAATSLDFCRSNPKETYHINVTQTMKLARRLVDKGVFVVFISTNLVFDGTMPQCKEDEPLSPMTEYGRQKAEAERLLSSLSSQLAIVRLTKVIHRGMPLLCRWFDEMKQGRTIAPFEDFVCAPISLEQTVGAIEHLTIGELSGIWQLSARSDTSYANLARQVAVLGKFDENLIQPVSCKGRFDLEHVPANTTLDVNRAENLLGFEPLSPNNVIKELFFT